MDRHDDSIFHASIASSGKYQESDFSKTQCIMQLCKLMNSCGDKYIHIE